MAEFEFAATLIPGLKIVRFATHRDNRGSFTKLFELSAFHGVFSDPVHELFFSRSVKGCVRGMHFQTPPYALAKLVFCLDGRIFDACVDLRKGSPAYSKHVAVELAAEKGEAVLVPQGVAHGFQSLADHSLTGYLTTSSHMPSHDHGIHAASAGITWPLPVSEISERDKAFPALSTFASPFGYDT